MNNTKKNYIATFIGISIPVMIIIFSFVDALYQHRRVKEDRALEELRFKRIDVYLDITNKTR